MKTRHLGERQMTADTAVVVSYKILCEGKLLNDLKFVDKPSIKIRRKEFIEMPFRYIQLENGAPLLPSGMIDLWKKEE